MLIFLFFALLIAVVAVVFALQNAAPATITFLAWQFEGSMALVLLVALGVGALVSLLASLPPLIRSGWTVSSQKRRLKQLETLVNEYQHKLEEAQGKVDALEAAEDVSEAPEGI